MTTSTYAINMIKSFEGYHLTAYKCPAGIWTIGYGHTKNATPGLTITDIQATAWLKEDLEKYEKNVMKYNNIYTWTQNEFDAMVSFAFNIGSIDKLTANGKRDKKTIAEKILLYNKANGKVLSGLTRRRQWEHDLFLKSTLIDNICLPTIKVGSFGTVTTKLQIYLFEKGLYHGEIDGIFGPKTEDAVKRFQSSLGIKPDGIVGPVTWSFID